MARKPTTKWAGSKPIRRRKTKSQTTKEEQLGRRRAVQAQEPTDKAIPEDEAGIMAEIMELCDNFDIMMTQPDRGMVHITQPWGPENPFRELRRRMDKLTQALREVVPRERQELSQSSGLGAIEAIVLDAIACERGQVPPWSRAGTFVVWAGRVPIRCEWHGYPFPIVRLYAADPYALFPNSDGVAFGNSQTMSIDPSFPTVDQLFRWAISTVMTRTETVKKKVVPAFKLMKLSAQAQERTLAYLSENEWLRQAIRRDPVDPLPLPKHLRSLQLPL